MSRISPRRPAEGRLVQIAVLSGSKVALDLARIMQRRINITGSTLRPRAVAQESSEHIGKIMFVPR